MTFDLQGALAKMVDAAREGLEKAADDVHDRADVLVPQDSGDLKDSGRVTGSGDQRAISYGRGKSAAYAVLQHEKTELRHDTGQSGWLRDAMFSEQDRTLGIIGDSVRKVIQ